MRKLKGEEKMPQMNEKNDKFIVKLGCAKIKRGADSDGD